jgi:two-component system, chemotaxis family, chemotaxis protein CheY
VLTNTEPEWLETGPIKSIIIKCRNCSSISHLSLHSPDDQEFEVQAYRENIETNGRIIMTENSERCRVLVVDDDPMMKSVLRLVLDEIGVEVVGEAENGSEAVVLFKEHSPDLTLLDIEMPVQNGFQTLTEIRKLNGESPVIMLTGNDNPAIAGACLGHGANDYIGKGQAPAELLEVLRSKLISMKLIDHAPA